MHSKSVVLHQQKRDLLLIRIKRNGQSIDIIVDFALNRTTISFNDHSHASGAITMAEFICFRRNNMMFAIFLDRLFIKVVF